MESVASWPKLELQELFEQTGANRAMAPAIAEKDFWVCWTLGRLFASEELRTKIVFKGGTSLSKVFGLIERFSEDIDLILDWNELSTEEPLAERSNRAKDRFREQTLDASRRYLQEKLLPALQRLLGDLCDVTYEDVSNAPHTIDIVYPASFPNAYLRNQIRLDIRPLAVWTPNAIHEIQSYAAEEFPRQFQHPRCQVRAVNAERTFWDKVTILHREAHQPENRTIDKRQSRHYYDLAQMAECRVRASALKDLDLLSSVVEEKQQFYRQTWAKFELVRPGTVKLIPPERVLRVMMEDYSDMREMFYGEIPTFERILEVLQDLEEDINTLA